VARLWRVRPPFQRPFEEPATVRQWEHVAAPSLTSVSLDNVLVTGGRLAGVIDTENLGVGDRCVDRARLAFDWYLLARAGTPGLAADAPERLTRWGQAISGRAGWRVAVAYELISRIGWRSDHHTQTGPHRLVPACAEFLGLPAIQ